MENFSFWYLQSFKLIWDLTGSMIREGAALASEKSQKIFRFFTFENPHEYCIVSTKSCCSLLEEQIRAIIGLPVLWSRHVRHLDSGLCSNAPMPHTQCPLNNRTLCKKIFSYSNNLKTHMKGNHVCDFNNLALNTMNTTSVCFQFSETRSLTEPSDY